MQTKELQPGDLELVRSMWGKRGDLIALGFNIRQQYLEAEGKVYGKVDELDAELNTLVKILRDKIKVSEDWKLDLGRGVFVGPPTEVSEETVESED